MLPLTCRRVACADEGGGIYRHVKLTVAEPVSILPWGVNAPSVIAPAAEYSISGGLDGPQTASAAIVSVAVDVANALTTNETTTLTTTLLDEDGEMVTEAQLQSVLPAGGWARLQAPLHFPEQPPAAGSVLQLGLCTGGRSQRFTLADSTISTVGADGAKLCVEQTGGATAAGDLTLQPCKPGLASQKFVHGSPKLP